MAARWTARVVSRAAGGESSEQDGVFVAVVGGGVPSGSIRARHHRHPQAPLAREPQARSVHAPISEKILEHPRSPEHLVGHRPPDRPYSPDLPR